MKNYISSLIKFLIIITLIFVLSGCGGSGEDEIDPTELLNLSTERMRELGGFQYRIDRTGEPAFIDADQSISFASAVGYYVVPDRVTATVKVITPLAVAEVDIINIGDQQWETNIFTGTWQKVPVEYSFQPQDLLNPESGLLAILESDMVDLAYNGLVELEEMPGLQLHHLQGTIDGENAYNLTSGMIDSEPLAVQFWIDPGTYEIHGVLVVDPMDEGEEEDTIWQIDFWDFDNVIDISPPIEE